MGYMKKEIFVTLTLIFVACLWYNRPGYEETLYLDANGYSIPKEIEVDGQKISNPDIVSTKVVRTGDQVIPGPSDSLKCLLPAYN